MNVTTEFLNGRENTFYMVQLQDIIDQQKMAYANLMLIISALFVLYVIWNNFVRSPSKPIGLKQAIKDNLDVQKQMEGLIDQDLGIEPSKRVKRISRAIDEYILLPALVLFYIMLQYNLSIR
jgi:hypothetical protein